MKKYLLIFVLLICKIAYCQTPQFKSYLAFEDALGNKDTIWIGYDEMATIGVDTIFGENDIKDTPFDSVFEVRTTTYVNQQFQPINGYYQTFNTLNHLKTQIITTPCSTKLETNLQILPILIHAKHYPIKVEWQYPEAFNDDSCLVWSLFNPICPSIWFDAGIDYSSGLPAAFFNIYLKNYTSYVFDNFKFFNNYIDYPPEYYINEDNDTIRLLNLALIPKDGHYTNISNNFTSKEKITIFPNPAADHIIIKNENHDNSVVTIEIIDLTGKVLIKETQNSSSQRICLQKLQSGVYFARISTHKNTSIQKFLIIK